MDTQNETQLKDLRNSYQDELKQLKEKHSQEIKDLKDTIASVSYANVSVRQIALPT